MALRAVVDHPKFKRLKALLGCSMREALGTLEGVWHFCARYTPRGDIGRYSDADIEGWLEWGGEEGALLAALVRSGWLDADPEHRLVVHHWADHADDTVHTELAKKTLLFTNGQRPRLSKKSLSGEARARIRAEYAKAGEDVPPQSLFEGEEVHPIPEPEPEPEPEPSWAAFCEIYPRRSGSLNQAAAKKKFRELCRSPGAAERVLEGVRRYRGWCDSAGKSGTEYVAQMTTWLNRKGWLEEYGPAPRAPAVDGERGGLTDEQLEAAMR